MPSCVIVERDSHHIDQIRNALTTEGWQVVVLEDPVSARQHTDPSPDLVFASTELPGALDFLREFSKQGGDCSSVALLPASADPAAFEADGIADLVLLKPFDDSQLWAAVRTLLSARVVPDETPGPQAPQSKLTSVDIFGDMLAEMDDDPGPAPIPSTPEPPEVPDPAHSPQPLDPTPPDLSAAEEKAPRKPSKDSDDVERKLEETLSGILTSPVLRKKAPEPKPSLSRDLTNIDKLLSDTLSGLELSGSNTRASDRKKQRAESPEPPPQAQDAVADEVDAILEGLDLQSRASPLPEAVEPELEISFPEPVYGETSSIETSPDDSGLTSSSERVSPDTPDPSGAEETVGSQPPPDEIQEEDLIPEPDLDLSFFEDLLPADGDGSSEVLPPPDPIPESAPEEDAQKAKPEPPAFEGKQLHAAPGQRFGHYTLLERIAIGGMAELWKARMEGVAGFQKTVAIKKILPQLTENREFERMFVDEAKLAAELNHPNITHIYDLGNVQDDYYIAMEYVEGKNLRSILNMASRKGIPVPHELALLIASRLASALDYAHRKRDEEDRSLGIVHRDVSPQNVLISYEGDIKLCDFGIAKAVTKLSKTETGALKGKLQYMSPEQAWGRAVDHRSDIFSLGSLLFEMLTGLRLFGGETEISVLEAVRECRVRTPGEFDPSTPPSVDALVAKALAKEPGDRFPSAGRMRDEIESSLETLTLRPSNAELASYLRQLVSAPDAAETSDAGPTRRKERVARFPFPGEEEPGSAVFLDPLSGSEASGETGEEGGDSDVVVAAVAPLEETPEEPRRRGKTFFLILLLAALLVAFAVFYLKRPKSASTPAARPPAASPGPAGETTVQKPAAGPNGIGEGSDSEAPAAAKGEVGTTELLDREREKIQQALADQLAQQEKELRRAYEARQKNLESRIEEIAPDPSEIAEPGPGVKAPVLVSIEKPKYPAGALQDPASKDILLSVLVDKTGKVEQVRPVRGADSEGELSKAAAEAAKTAVFEPATKEGQETKMWTTLKISFPQ